jgi:hypothetical protein
MSSAPALVDTFFVTLRAPWSVRPSALGLEVTVVACGVLALLHALRERRRGDGLPLFTWLCSFTYGIVMELVSYNFIKSFAHGPFCVMFYKGQLPLYVVTVYPVLQYTGIVTARRLRSGIVAQAFTAGLLIVAMDVPFDILGPTQGWWSWSDTDPNIAARWYGVPVTSYYWHLAFGGILAALTRALGRWGGDPGRPLRGVALALPVSALVIVLGVISFLPFHFLKARGVPDGAIVAGLVVVSVIVAALSRRAPAASGASLLAIPMLFYAYHLLVALGRFAAGPGAFGGQAAAIVAVTALALLAHGGAVAAPGREPARLPAE